MKPSPLHAAASQAHDAHGLSPDQYKVALASALLWTFRSTTDLHRLLSLSGLPSSAGKTFTASVVKAAALDLRSRQLLVDEEPPGSRFRLVDSLRVPLYRHLLLTGQGDALVNLIAELDRFNPAASAYYWPTGSMPATIAYVRAKFHSGAASDDLSRLKSLVARSMDWETILCDALLLPFDAASFAYIEPGWRVRLTYQAIAAICLFWAEEFLPVAEWASERLRTGDFTTSSDLRAVVGDLALQRGDRDLLTTVLDGLEDGLGAGIRAAQRVIAGQWAAGQAEFETAFKLRKGEIGGNKRLLPDTIAWYYPLALLAQGTPRHLELARRFCAGQARQREPAPYASWGRWVHAIDVRLGKAAINRAAFAPPRDAQTHWPLDSVWNILLAAWLGRETIAESNPVMDSGAWQEAIAVLRRKIACCRLTVFPPLLDGSQAVLAGREPPDGFFIAGNREHWRDVLQALQAFGNRSTGGDANGSTRVLWELLVSSSGELLAIEPLEQKRGQRGWGRPRTLTLARLAGNQQLAPADAKVARAIRLEHGYRNRYRLDLATAVVALVGHPCIVLPDAPEQFVDLSEGMPALEVLRRGDGYVMRIDPPLRSQVSGLLHAMDADEKRCAEALRLLTLVRDGPQRLRLVRYSAAQQQVAQLVSGHFSVPAEEPAARTELSRTLHALASHFQVHADAAQASRQVGSDSRLRAELSPVGEALSLRLIVAPLGADGPRLPPAAGRRRLLAALGSETVGTERDFAAERRHLDSLLDALPFLDGGNGRNEWLIEDAQDSLATVEALPTLPAVAAVDWPQGKQVRVLRVDSRQLGVKISRERDWFRLSGHATLDEGLIVQLETLLAAARTKSRFVPIGDGVYAALTRALQQKLNDLTAVVETDRTGAKVATVAAAWLDQILDGSEVDASLDFRRAIDRLRQAQDTVPSLPKLLQASLRPYQEDGYQWAIRLANAGVGGCLADDMGLGKTLQALGVLLERASGGAALVVAPTSVCGNWLAEARRFAPSLEVRLYREASESEREALLAAADRQDLLIVSYTLLQLAQERFAGRRWHTLIADEAQAVKNAAAKRSQALFGLDADFRLALTGTPVENRLADLWSIMRFVNPGLLGSARRFEERFAAPIERNHDREAQHVLKRLVGPFVLRRTKSEVLQELPARTELILAVVPEAAEAAHYEALRREAANEIDTTLEGAPQAQARFNILAQLTRLRRAACDPRLCSPELGIVGAKLQAFRELAAELVDNGHKALVFSQFIDFLVMLREQLEASGITYQYLDGATPASERSRRVAAFQAGEGDLFLISLKAGGFGLNLTAADYVVITDPWWNPASEDQASGRAHRIGQERPVTVYRLVTKGTVEERIVALHHEKRALAESILAEGVASAVPSTEDLMALIRGD